MLTLYASVKREFVSGAEGPQALLDNADRISTTQKPL